MIISDLTPPYDIIIDQNNNAFIANQGKFTVGMNAHSYAKITHMGTEPFHGLTTTIESVPADTQIFVILYNVIHIH